MKSSPASALLLLLGLLACTASALAAQPSIIPNAGFEDGSTGWVSSKEDSAASLSTVTAKAAHTGKAGLQIDQPDGGPGSWFQTAKFTIVAGQKYQLQFWGRTLKSSGVGVWVNFYTDDGQVIKEAGTLAVQMMPDVPEWTKHTLDLQAPANAAYATVAVHCYSKRATLAYLDDFDFVASPAAPAAH